MKNKEKVTGVYYDATRGHYYIKFQGKTRRGLTEAEANRYSLGLRNGFITFDDIDRERYPERVKEDNSDIPDNLIMFYDIAYEFLKLKHSTKTYGTYRSAKDCFENRIKPAFPNKPMNKINIVDCNNLRTEIDKLHLVAKTKNYTINLFISMVKYGIKIHHLKDDPTIYIERFKESVEEKMKRIETSKNVWTPDEFNKFIEEVERPEYKLLFILMYYTGMRIGEVQALKWKYIKDYVIQVRESLTEESEGGGCSLKDPKTIMSVRDIDIDSNLKSLLDEYKEKEMATGCFDENWYVLGRTEPLHRTTIDRIKKNAINKAGVKYIKNHQMRHSHASNLIAAGVPMPEVSARLGHNDSSFTAKIYVHSTRSGKEKLLETLESFSPNLLHSLD